MTSNRYPGRRLTVVLILVCLLMVANLLVAIQLLAHARQATSQAMPQNALPCPAIPTRFVLDDPQCADKLLRAMNVTDVRVLSKNHTTNG